MAALSTHTELSPQELADILRVTCRIGVLMLRSGAASFRADQTMERLALVLGAERIDSYVTPTGVIVSVYSGREHRTQITRITSLAVDMNRVVEVELLSGNLKTGATPQEIAAELDRIEHVPPNYPPWIVVLAVAVACGAFAFIVGGGLIEAFAAMVGAGAAQAIRLRMVRAKLNPIVVTVVCSAIATAVSYGLLQAAPHLGIVPKLPRAGVVASVLLMVPGVPLVTAMLDLTRYDLVSGIARGAYAFILLVSIAIGMLLILAWTGFKII
jgi:uncharacterized membrane protein YjjP (DUF1212 family)